MLPFEPFTVQALGSPEVFQPDENRKDIDFGRLDSWSRAGRR
jgi:hypothetical protein